MKLHKLPQVVSSDFSSQTANLAEKYLGRLDFGSTGANQQVLGGGGRKGRYPPSRDGEFKILMMQKEQEEAMKLGEGGHGVPLTSESRDLIVFFWEEARSFDGGCEGPHFRTRLRSLVTVRSGSDSMRMITLEERRS